MDQMNTAQQEQSVDHAGYLMAYDKKEKRAKGVTGIDADGNLTLEEAAGENRHHFMKVDRHGNILSNFGKNFMYQFNNPSGFLFYHMPKDTKPEVAAQQIEDCLHSEDESARRSLSSHRIYNEHLFNEREIDWRQAERYGITPDQLRYGNNLERMLQGRQSTSLVPIRFESELGRQRGDAKLSLYRAEDGSVKFDAHFVRRALREGEEFRGYKLTADDIKNLNTTGNLGHTPELIVDYSTMETRPCYVSKDPLTNEMFGLRRDRANLVRKVKDYTLSEQEFNDYVAGKEVKVTFTSANGKKVTTGVQMSAAERGMEFLFERSTTLSQKEKESMRQAHASRRTPRENQSAKRNNSIKPH